MAYSRSTHEDYFVSRDHEAVRREQKHFELRRKQQTQYAIAQQLSALDKDEYGEEHLRDMLDAEVISAHPLLE